MALLVQLLLAFGNAIGRGPHFMAEADRHGLNLFACLVGATAKGRKGTSWGHVRRIFEATDPKWVKEGIASGLSSGEGLIWAVRNPIERNEPVKEKGRTTGYETVLVDEGVEDKRLLVFEGEFASVLRILGREGNTLSAIIRNAWDTGELRSLTKNSPAVASGAHISISGLGSITGSVIAATLVTVAMEVLRALEEPRVILGMFLPGIPGMRMVVFSIALMAVILFYPKGFMGDREVSLDSFRNLAARFRRTFLRKQV
jgi:hypothetical protein